MALKSASGRCRQIKKRRISSTNAYVESTFPVCEKFRNTDAASDAACYESESNTTNAFSRKRSSARLNKNVLALVQKKKNSDEDTVNPTAENSIVSTVESKETKTRLCEGGASARPHQGVIYLGHIPPGFTETQMARFFSQFGDVTGVVLRRSRKTGQSKGYGYVQFDLPEVAAIVAETMNNYLMFGRTLVCELVCPARVPRRLFRNWGKKLRLPSTRTLALRKHNKSEEKPPSQKQMQRRLEQDRKKAKLLTALGIDFPVKGLSFNESTSRSEDAAPLPRAKANSPALPARRRVKHALSKKASMKVTKKADEV